MSISTASSFYVEQVRNVTVLCFTSRSLTVHNYHSICDELFEFISLVTAERPVHVVAELLSISDIDDMGVAMLQAFSDSIHDAGGTLILCRVQSRVMSAIRKSRLRCAICVTRSEALWSF